MTWRTCWLFPRQSAEEHVCRVVYICQLKSTCSVSSQGLLTMPLTFSLTPTVFQVAECSNSQSCSLGDVGCVPWLTLPSPNLWQAQGPLHPCDTLLPKLNPLLFFLVCDVITLGTGAARRTPILFSFLAIKYYVRADFSSSFPKCVWRFLRSTRVFISAVPRRGRNDQSLCATGIAQFTAPPCALAHHSAWRWAYHCSDQLYDPVRRIRLPFCTSGLPNK